MTWSIVTPHGVFRSPRLHERWVIPVPGAIGIDRVCFLTSVDTAGRVACFDRIETVYSSLGYADDAEAALEHLMKQKGTSGR